MGKAVDDLAPEALALLVRHDYPGNVRELANLIERGVALARGGRIEASHLPESLRLLPPRRVPRLESPGELTTLAGNEAAYIAQVLKYTNGNRNQAAEILGIDRVSLWRRIKRFGLE